MSIHEKLINKTSKLAIVGLGYVGLPLAIEFGKLIHTIGFDLNRKRIADLKNRIDINNETPPDELKSAELLEFTSDPERLKEAEFIIIAVPTPITKVSSPTFTA